MRVVWRDMGSVLGLDPFLELGLGLNLTLGLGLERGRLPAVGVAVGTGIVVKSSEVALSAVLHQPARALAVWIQAGCVMAKDQKRLKRWKKPDSESATDSVLETAGRTVFSV
jgi:hypothetical protein